MASMASEAPDRVQTLDKAFSILDIVGRSPAPMPLREIVDASGLTKTTVHRICKSLCRHELLTMDRHAEYVLGPQMIRLGARALSGSVAQVGQDVVAALYESTRMTVCLCTLHEYDIVYLLKKGPPVTIVQEVGDSRPAHCTALGKVMLAHLPERELDRLLKKYGLPRMTPNTIVDEDAFREEMERIRQLGYAVNRCEAHEQVEGVAAPIFDLNRRCIASISVTVILALRSKDTAEYAGPVMDAAAAISERMGYVKDMGQQRRM